MRGPNCRSRFSKFTPSFVFKLHAHIISFTISKLLNASIADGQFPEILKGARLIQIFKAGLREIINDYRSILYWGLHQRISRNFLCKRLDNCMRSRDILM